MSEDMYEKDVDLVLTSIGETLLSEPRAMGAINVAEFGEFGVLVRVADKVTALKKAFANSEDTEHIWKDLACDVVECLAVFFEEDDIDEINRFLEEAEMGGNPPIPMDFFFKAGLA